MNTNAKNKNQGAVAKHDHPGRPMYQPKFPRSKEWTFMAFMTINGVNVDHGSKDFGKGPNCTMLTLRKWLTRDKARKGKSEVVIVDGVTADPESESGLGRRACVYRLRSETPKDHSGDKATSKPRKVKTSGTSAEVSKMVADAHAILAEPTPAVVITPEATPAPAAPIPDAVHNDFPAENAAPQAPAPVEVTISNETPTAPAPAQTEQAPAAPAENTTVAA